MAEVNHDDLHRLETRVGSRIDAERVERKADISSVRTEMIATMQVMHGENKAATADARKESRESFAQVNSKMDQFLEFMASAKGAGKASNVWGQILGWVVALVVSMIALLHK